MDLSNLFAIRILSIISFFFSIADEKIFFPSKTKFGDCKENVSFDTDRNNPPSIWFEFPWIKHSRSITRSAETIFFECAFRSDSEESEMMKCWRENVTNDMCAVNSDAVVRIVVSNPSKIENDNTKAITPKDTLPMATNLVKRRNFEPPEYKRFVKKKKELEKSFTYTLYPKIIYAD